MLITAVYAIDQQGGVGYNNQLPWGRDYPEDLAHFKRITLHKFILMGRKTFESLPFVLPQRFHCVISSQNLTLPSNCKAFNSVQQAIDYVKIQRPIDYPFIQHWNELCCIGGAHLLTQLLANNQVSTVYLTTIHTTYPSDTFLNHNFSQWTVKEQSQINSLKGAQLTFTTYQYPV